MIVSLGQNGEEPENGNGENGEEPNGNGVHHIRPFPFPIRQPYPVYYPVATGTDEQGLQIGESTIPMWVLVLGLGLLAGYVMGSRT